MATLTALEAVLPFEFQLTVFTLIGLCFGSFSTMLLHRLPRSKNIRGRSGCPVCNHQLRWYELLPVLSYVLLLGKCSACRKKISLRYPIIELLCGALFFLIGFIMRDVPLPLLIPFSIACFSAFVIALYDAETQRIPDMFTGILAIAAILYQAGMSLIRGKEILLESLQSGMVVGGFFGAMWVVSRGRWIGSGDIFLGMALGLLLSFPHAILMLFAAYALGAIVAAYLLITKKIGRNARIAFAPFLVLGTFLSLFFGDSMIAWYTSLLVG